MNITKYVKKFGSYTFIERRFSDVDSLIFAELAYINFHLLVDESHPEIVIKNITNKQFSDFKLFEGSVDAKRNKKLLILMAASKRYQDIIIRDIEYSFSKDNDNQFYAFTIVLPTGNLYVAFRGTDTSLVGWKEDFLIAVYDKIKAQVQAEKYANRVLANNKARFYIGGHSKGGHLAFYAALNLNEEYDTRFIGAYSFDGPGFRDGITNFKAYERNHSRLIKYRTYNNMIGSVYEDVNHYKVVYSNGILGGHDPFFWQIVSSTGRFRMARDVSNSSRKFRNKLNGWLDGLNIHDKFLFIEAFFTVFDGNDTIYDLFKNLPRNIINLRKALSVFSVEEQTRLKNIFRTFIAMLLSEKSMRKVSRKEQNKNEVSSTEEDNN